MEERLNNILIMLDNILVIIDQELPNKLPIHKFMIESMRKEVEFLHKEDIE